MSNIPGWPVPAFMLVGMVAILGWYYGCLLWNLWRRRGRHEGRTPNHQNRSQNDA